ncbi:MAG TPA: NADH-quinone oxidoreductase subunit J [Peptococcaceae bacterium]|nr:NADH-quinone oxidoreductase subunit J [Peptococcaceae bacterium]
MENSLELIAFFLLAGSLLTGALMVVTLKNLVNSVLSLIVVFFSLAGIFILLNADFLAAVQVLVYAGGVCIMLVFGVMLVQRKDMRESNPVNRRFLIAAPLTGALFLLIGLVAAKSPWVKEAGEVPENTIEHLAPILLRDYVIPFEAVAILLTVALTGVLLLVKEVKDNGRSS